MGKKLEVLGLLLCLFVLTLGAGAGYGQSIIDGYVDDWGIDLTASGADMIGYLDTHHPSGGLDIDYVTEDNTDKYKKWREVGPLWSYYNWFDAEALYFDNDQSYAYIALITGMPEGGYQAPDYPLFDGGDIAIDVDNDPTTGEYGFEYGIDIFAGELKAVDDWQDVYYSEGSAANPYRILSHSSSTPIDFVYSGVQNSHYVLEARFPLSYLELSAEPGDLVHRLKIHWAEECGNDFLTLNADVNPVFVPEPSTFVLFGLGALGLFGYGWKRRKQTKK